VTAHDRNGDPLPGLDHVGRGLRTNPVSVRCTTLSLMKTRRHWVIVASHDHARRGVNGGFVMANHCKRSPMARMSPGDGVLIYSPTTAYPHGEPLRAVTIVGEVTGDEPEAKRCDHRRIPSCGKSP
jgi:hypothetical protein